MARRQGLSPQQLVGWRRQLREAAARHSEAEELPLVPALVDLVATAHAVRRRREAWRCKSEPDVGTIETEVDGVTIRAGHGRGRNHDCGHRSDAEGEPMIGATGTVRV